MGEKERSSGHTSTRPVQEIIGRIVNGKTQRTRRVHCFVAPAYRHQTLSNSISPLAWPDIRTDFGELFA